MTIWYILEVLNGEIWGEDTRKYPTLEAVQSVAFMLNGKADWKYRICKITKEVLEESE